MDTGDFSRMQVLLLLPVAFLLSMRPDERLVAEASTTQLRQKTEHGPEGGRAILFILAEKGRPEKQFLVSRTLNPGDGTKRETVSVADCVAAAENLRREKLPAGTIVNPQFCQSGLREKIVLFQAESAGAHSHNCKANEVPYFEAGCEGPGNVRCWPQNVRPTPMETCLCNGQTGNAPLPGGGLRWRHAGRCKSMP